jgi:hypothetical protein
LWTRYFDGRRVLAASVAESILEAKEGRFEEVPRERGEDQAQNDDIDDPEWVVGSEVKLVLLDEFFHDPKCQWMQEIDAVGDFAEVSEGRDPDPPRPWRVAETDEPEDQAGATGGRYGVSGEAIPNGAIADIYRSPLAPDGSKAGPAEEEHCRYGQLGFRDLSGPAPQTDSEETTHGQAFTMAWKQDELQGKKVWGCHR